MCTFLSALPKRSKSNGVKRNNLPLFMRPCKDDANGKKTWYRFRLLAWTSPEKNDRDDVFIERFMHQIWKKNEKGFMEVVDEVTCPVTKHVHVEGNRYDACPICKVANQYFMTWKESNWKNREAAKKNKEIGRKYQAIIPVYVVDDPNYQNNRGQVKVLIFNDKKFYQEFRSKVEKASQTACVFNGKNAVDCCMHMSEIQEVVNEGQPNEYKYTRRVIDKIVFSKDPYSIEAITKELVTDCGFDEEYYGSSTPEELQMFYDRHFKISNDDIPEDDDVQVYDEPKSSPAKTVPPPVNIENDIDDSDDISVNDIDDIVGDTEADSIEQIAKIDAEPEQKKSTNDDDIDITDADELLKGLDL